VSILGGFLTDLLGDRKTGPARSETAKSRTEKSAKAREDRNSLAKGAKARDTRTPVTDAETVASTTTTKSKDKASLGRLNAAHALVNGKPNASANSTVGQLMTYMDAVNRKNTPAAASALTALANKRLDEKSIEALNHILGLDVSAVEMLSAIRKAEETPSEETDTPSTDPTDETPSDAADTSPDQPAEAPSDTADASPDEPAPPPSETAAP
jgi:hypothetical protein